MTASPLERAFCYEGIRVWDSPRLHLPCRQLEESQGHPGKQSPPEKASGRWAASTDRHQRRPAWNTRGRALQAPAPGQRGHYRTYHMGVCGPRASTGHRACSACALSLMAAAVPSLSAGMLTTSELESFPPLSSPSSQARAVSDCHLLCCVPSLWRASPGSRAPTCR